MPELDDDHARAIALRWFVTRLIAEQCKAARDPDKALGDWATAVEMEKEAIGAQTFGEGVSDTIAMNGLSIMGELDLFLDEIRDTAAA